MERRLWRQHAFNKGDLAGTKKENPAQQLVARDDECHCNERKNGGTGENAAASRKQVWRVSLLNL